MAIALLTAIALVVAIGAFVASRRWIGAPDDAPGAGERARTLQKLALGVWGLILATNVLQVTVGDERLDALGVFVIVTITFAAACLIYELRKPVSKPTNSE